MPDRWTAEQLPAIDWEPDQRPARTPEMRGAERLDLRACGLTAHEMHTMTTVKISKKYL